VHGVRAIGDVQGAADAAPLVGAGSVVLQRLEGGQEVVIAPAWIAGDGPGVEILARPPDIDHGVDRARTAEQLAARPVVGIAGKARIRLGLVVPVDGRIEEGLAVAERHLDIETTIGSAGLQYQHGETARGREPFRDDRSGRAGADDDEIINLHDVRAGSEIRRLP